MSSTVPSSAPPEEVSLDALRAAFSEIPRGVLGTIGVYEGRYVFIPDVGKNTLIRGGLDDMPPNMYVFNSLAELSSALTALIRRHAISGSGPVALQFDKNRQCYPREGIDPSQLFDLTEFYEEETPPPAGF